MPRETTFPAVYVPQQRSELVYEINRQFPNVTAIDLGMLLERFRKLADQGSGAISVVFLFTLASALLVFTGMIQGTATVPATRNSLAQIHGSQPQVYQEMRF